MCRIMLAVVFLVMGVMIAVNGQTPKKDVESVTEKEGAASVMPAMAEGPTKHDLVERSYILNDFYGSQVSK